MRKRSFFKTLDHKIFNFFKVRKNKFWDKFFLVITHSIAPVTVIFAFTFLSIYVIVTKQLMAESFILILCVLPVAIGSKIKKILSKPRPDKNIQKVRISERSYSMPSTHAGVATSLYGFLAFLALAKYTNNELFIFCILMIFLICYSRIYLLVHYFSDVIGGIILGLIVLFPLIYSYEQYYDFLDSKKLIWIILIISWIFIVNYYRKCRDEIPEFLKNPPQMVKRIYTAFIVIAITFIPIWIGGKTFDALMLVIYLFGIYEIISANENPSKYILKSISILILGLMIWSIIILRNFENGIFLVFIFATISAMSDSCGYFIGKYFGKTKNIIKISPEKTLEGTLSAIIIPTLLIGTIIYNFVDNSYIFSLILSLSAIAGDLLESLLKRNLEIKDFSSFLPGHGGILDRVDSNIFAGFVLFLLITSNLFKFH